MTVVFCQSCHVAVMQPHPELREWLKCPCCGYCVKIEEPKKL